MRLEFYYDKREGNQTRVKEILELLEKAKKRGIKCEIRDLNGVHQGDVFKIYEKAWRPSIWKRYKLRTVFGSHRRPGIFFGKKEPALLVYEENSDYPMDVYPHDDHGRISKIEEALREIIGK